MKSVIRLNVSFIFFQGAAIERHQSEKSSTSFKNGNLSLPHIHRLKEYSSLVLPSCAHGDFSLFSPSPSFRCSCYLLHKFIAAMHIHNLPPSTVINETFPYYAKPARNKLQYEACSDAKLAHGGLKIYKGSRFSGAQ